MHGVSLTKRIRSKNSASKLTINSCHPGTVDTDLIRIKFFQNVLKKVFKPFLWYFMKTDQDGAQTPLYLALSKKVSGISGKYFRFVYVFKLPYLLIFCSDCSLASVHPLANDENSSEILYNSSIEACGLHNTRY